MEGLVDAVMRDTLTRIGGLDRAVTEFVRVSETELPPKVFYRLCPELNSGGCTPSGVPVRVQLLGSDPALLALCARRAASLGAPAIDLNFGCPAKTVNRSRGGAVLLQEPALIERIVAAVRSAVPAELPVSAKMRLGYDDSRLALDNAVAIEAGGADELCVHGRTKAQGYGGSADWPAIGRIRAALSIPVVANGDVCSVEDYFRCRELSGCDSVMLGRGLVARPGLALQIRQALAGQAPVALEWLQLQVELSRFFAEVCERVSPRHAPGRLKQWLAMLKRSYPEAEVLFQQLRTENRLESLSELLAQPMLARSA
nr:tRNA-dihydrouridine synthase family protein [Motiliproteus sediminis]